LPLNRNYFFLLDGLGPRRRHFLRPYVETKLPAERPRRREAPLIRPGAPLLGFQQVCRASGIGCLVCPFPGDGVEATFVG
jgi:hypothetical protein